MSVDRRSYARFPISKTPCRAKIGGDQHRVFQTDMSINGLGIVGLDFRTLAYGEKITIEFDDETVEGVCCSAYRLPNGGLHIGIRRSCKYVATRNLQGSLVKRFVDCGECEIPCDIISSDPMFAFIRLPMGKSFQVPTHKINSRTHGERIESLGDDEQLALFLDFYKVDRKLKNPGQDKTELINTIVNLEFGVDSVGAAGDSTPNWKLHSLST